MENTAGIEGEGFCKMYGGIADRADKARVDKVGIAILGRTHCDTGTYSEAPNPRAKAWWDMLDGFERIGALYGNGITNTVGDAYEPETSVSKELQSHTESTTLWTRARQPGDS